MKKKFISVLLSIIMLVGMIPLAVIPTFAETECQHTDTNEDGYCDICEIAVESSVTLFAPVPVTRTLKAGTKIKEALSDVLVSQGVEGKSWFYADGSTVGDTDTVPYGMEILGIYPTVYYKAEDPVCGEGGHMGYYYDPFDGRYYEDENFTSLIGFDTTDGLQAWLALEDGGLIQPTVEHTFECCEDSTYGHICTNEDCKYHGQPAEHVFSADKTYCVTCGAKCYQACDSNPSSTTSYTVFANKFVNDGQPLKYKWYYVDKSVILDDILIIAGNDVRLILANGVTFEAKKGYHCLPDCSFSVYYQSKNEDQMGVFTGTEYKCCDAASGEYYETHRNVVNNICDRCEKSICKHKILCDYKWSEDYSACHLKIKCAYCFAVLDEGDGEIKVEPCKIENVLDPYQGGDCQTKTQFRYEASFYSATYGSFSTHKTVETEYGAHKIENEIMNYCTKCHRTDSMGTVVEALKIFEIAYFITHDEMFVEYKNLLKAAKTEKDIQKVMEEFYIAFSDADYDMDTIKLLENISSTDGTMLNYARKTQYPSSIYKLLKEYEPSLKAATSIESYESIWAEAEAAAESLATLKKGYIAAACEMYENPEGGYLIDVNDFNQILHGIIYASTEEEVKKALELKSLEEVKESAKKAIDDAAGENQSAAIQKIVADTKDAIDGALTKLEVRIVKNDGLQAIKAQLKKEAEEAAALAEAKLQAKEDIDEAAGENQSAAIQKIVTDAKAAIDTADSIEKVETERQNGLSAIEAQLKKEAEEAAALADAKIQAKKDIDETTGENHDDIIKLIADAAKKIIDSASSVEEVLEIRDKWVDAIERLIVEEPHEHTFSTEYSKNEAAHWFAATCEHDVVTGMAAHTFGEGVVDGNKTTYTCTVCGYEKVETEDETAKLLEEALAELAEVKGELAEKEAALAAANKEKADLADKLQKKEAELAEANKTHSAEVEALKKEIAGLKDAINEKDKEISAKQATIDSLNSQLDAAKKEIERLKEQGGDPGTGNTCPKCGGTHANDFFGKIVCFFNQIGNFFKNLFK